MPNQIHFYQNKRFLAPGEIRTLEISPDGTKVLAFCGSYDNYKLSSFDSTTGAHLQDLKIYYKDFDFCFYNDGNSLYFADEIWIDGGERDYFLSKILPDSELKVEDFNFKFRSIGYFRDYIFTEKEVLVGNSNSLLIFDRHTKTLIRELKGPWTDNSNGISISQDGKLVVFGNWETNEVQVYSVSDGVLLKSFTVPKLHDQHGPHLKFLPDSKTLYVAANLQAGLWDVKTGKLIREIKVKDIYQCNVMQTVFSRDGQYMLCFYTGLHLALFRISDGEQLWIKTNADGLHGFCFSADAKTVYHSVGMNILQLDTVSGEAIGDAEESMGTLPSKIFKLPEENALLALFGKQAVKIGIDNGKSLSVLYADRWPNFSFNDSDPNSAFNLLCAGDYNAKLINAHSGRQKVALSSYHGVTALSSEYIAATDGYMSRKTVKELYIYNHAGALLHKLAKHQKNTPVYGMKFLSDGIRFAGIGEKFIALWDAAEGKQIWQQAIKNATYADIQSDPEGKYLFVNNSKQQFFCFDALNGNTQWEYSFLAKKEQNKLKAAFVSGKFVLLVAEAGDIRLLDITNGKELQKTVLNDFGISAACLDGNKLIVIHSNTALAHYDMSDWFGTTLKTEGKKSDKTADKTIGIAVSTTDFKGKSLLFTGTLSVPRKEAEEKAEAAGAVILSGVNKKLDYLIVGEDAGSKLDKAKSLGVKILNEQEFWSMLSPKSETANFQIPIDKQSASALLNYFRNADWSGFEWERDAEQLRNLLLKTEKEEGISELHKYCSQKLLEQSQSSKFPFFKLKHRFGHLNEIVGYGLSKDAKYLATGSWVGDDYNAGGELMIWEVATGRCVNIMDAVDGGVGWPDYSGCLQWSPDGKLLGLAINTNGVAVMKPFADTFVADEEVYLTDGWSRPAQWCWHPEGKAVYISCWDENYFLPGNVVPLDRKAFPLSRPYGFNKLPKDLFSKNDLKGIDNIAENSETGEKSPLYNYNKPGWSSKGYLFGNDNNFAFTQNPIDRSITTAMKKVSDASAWSSDGSFYLFTKERKIEVYTFDFKLLLTLDLGAELVKIAIGNAPKKGEMLAVDTSKGAPTLLFGNLPITDIERIVWHPNEALNLFAVLVEGDNGYAAIYKDFKFIGIAKTPIRAIGRWEMGDIQNLVFSEDGNKMAILSPEAEISVWSTIDMKKLISFEGIEDTKGILWGFNDVLITVNEQNLAFYHLENGELFSHFFIGLSNGDPLPDLSYSPLGRFAERFDLNPYFPIVHDGDTAWIAALQNGLVISDDNLSKKLEEELCYTIANRISWPYLWVTENRVQSLEKALEKAEFPFPEAIRKQITKTLSPTEKKAINSADYFMTASKKEIFGKNVKKNDYTFSDNSDDFWKDTRDMIQVDPLELALKKAKDYKLIKKLTGEEINYENLKAMLGKVVLYADKYSPTRVQVGTVVSVDEDSFYVFNIEFNDNKTQGGSGSSSNDFDSLPYIGLAEPR